MRNIFFPHYLSGEPYCLQGVAVAAKSDELYKNKKGVTEATPFCASRWA